MQRVLYIHRFKLVGVGRNSVLSAAAMTDELKVTTRSTAKLKNETSEPAVAPTLQDIDLKLNSILTILQKNSSDISDIKNEQKDMCASIEYCHANIKDIKQLISGQDLKITNCENDILKIGEETRKIENSVQAVANGIRDLEQYSHRNNLIVYGIPEEKNENIIFVVRRLAAALQFEDWSSNLIDAVHRMGKISGPRPRPIIIRFVSRLHKDMFLNKRKVRRNLKASDLGYSDESSVFVNESLTPSNRELLKKTQEKAKEMGYMHVWTANCNIYTRREKGSAAIKIASTKDLDRM